MQHPTFEPRTTPLRRRGRRRGRRGLPGLLSGLGLAAAALLGAAPLAAQQTGQVVGRVINAQSGEPMSDVQISVQGTTIGGLSNAQGRFLLTNVPVGEQTIVAQLIGYSQATETVTVTAGGVANVDITLHSSAVELEGVVVTGTAVESQKREVGNSIALITSEEITAVGAMNFEDLLRGRAAGVSVSGTPGSAGAGSDLVLRGTNSVNGRNSPLIYIDGVRMPSGALESDAGAADEQATFLGNIRPEDIERIEVIKGAAAASLYGTDASAGVIQVFTKKGTPGSPRWTFSMEQGLQTVGHVGPDIDPTGLHVNDCTRQFVFNEETMEYETLDEPDPGCPESGTWLRDAHVQDYSLSVRGGSDDVTYYASGGFGHTEGVIDPNAAQDVNVRGNFTFNGFEDLQININSFYTRREITWIPNGDNEEGFLFNVARGAEGATPNNNDALVLEMDLDQTVNHFNTSANINWTPMDNMRHRLTAGVDYSNSNSITFRPWLYWSTPQGDRTVDIEEFRTITLDYAGSWFTDLPADFTSTASFGVQFNQNERAGNRTDVEGFVGPGRKVLENAEEVTNYNEDYSAFTSGGFFLQEQLGWQNRLFLTVGFRADQHSSFGPDYDRDNTFTFYPRAQLAYTISDHDFWPAWFETFRIRAAYGESGEAPPATGGLTTFAASALADENQLGFIISSLANPNLGPERTKEYEGGFDGSLFNGRIGINATGYYRETFDGIIYVNPPPSSGIAETVPLNAGKWDSRGVEFGLDVIAFEGRDSRVSFNANYQYNKTEMVDLGDPEFDSFSFNYLQDYRPGYPLPSLFGRRLENADAIGELPIESDADTFFYGPSRPPHEMAVGATVTLFERLTLDAFGVAQFGHVLYDDLAQEMAQDGLWPECFEINARVKADDFADIPTRDIYRCSEDEGAFRNEAWFDDADYFRLQSASVSYRVPESWLPGNINAATVQLRGTNLFTLTDFQGLYPDALMRPVAQTARGNGFILPPAQTYTLNVRVNF